MLKTPQELALKFLKAQKSYERSALIQKQMAEKLLNLALSEKKVFENIFEFACGNGNLTKLLIKKMNFKRLVCNDINDYALEFKDKRISFQCFDMNALANQALSKEKFDLIISNAALQWLDAKQILPILSSMLATNSLLLLSSFGTRNLEQIKQSTGFGLNYLSLNEFKELLEQDFEILYLKSELLFLHFQSPLGVFKHLKESGVNSLGNFFLSKKFLQNYEEKFQNTLTYEPLYIFCRKV